MVFTRVYFLPLITFVLLPGTFIITYVISVLLRHVEPDFPYISDTGTYSPESCIFGQLLNIGAVLVILNVVVKYEHVREFYRQDIGAQKILRLNNVAVWLGLVAGCGLSIVANFQRNAALRGRVVLRPGDVLHHYPSLYIGLVEYVFETNVFVVHTVGALLCFGPGTVYLWLQALISYHSFPHLNCVFTAHLRLTLAVICTLAFITCIHLSVSRLSVLLESLPHRQTSFFYVYFGPCSLLAVVSILNPWSAFVTGPLSISQFHGKDKTKWYPDDGGFGLHVASTAAEWTLAICFTFFILTFVHEFQNIQIGLPQLYIVSDQEPVYSPSDVATRAGEDDGIRPDEPFLRSAAGQPPPFRELLA